MIEKGRGDGRDRDGRVGETIVRDVDIGGSLLEYRWEGEVGEYRVPILHFSPFPGDPAMKRASLFHSCPVHNYHRCRMPWFLCIDMLLSHHVC